MSDAIPHHFRLTATGYDFWIDVATYGVQGRWIACGWMAGELELALSSSESGAIDQLLSTCLGIEAASAFKQVTQSDRMRPF